MKAVRLPDARTALLESLRAGTEAYASEPDLARSILMLAATDPDAAAAVRRFEHGRSPGMRNLAGRLETQGYLRDDLSRDEAAQILWVRRALHRLRALAARTLLREAEPDAP